MRLERIARLVARMLRRKAKLGDLGDAEYEIRPSTPEEQEALKRFAKHAE